MEALFAKILELVGSVEGQAAIISICLEFVLRIIPSQKPLSILYIAAAALKGAGAVLSKAGQVLDKVLPQKIAEPIKE